MNETRYSVSSLMLRGVHKQFGSTVALQALDLAVREGELISLLGPSGCGKTTALRIVAGFERPDQGSVEVGGRSIVNLPPNKRDMGMVFQAYSLFPHLTAEENVAFGLRMHGVRDPERARRVQAALDLVGLADRAGNYPHQLSGGQQQRVALARALAIEPKVLLLDEPLSALDAKVRLQLRAEIRRIQKELGTTTLFVTHDQDEALALADRIGVMSAGRIEQLAAPSEIYDRPATAFVARFVGRMNELSGRVAGTRAVTLNGATLTGVGTGGRSPGAEVSVLVRPEHVRLCAVGDGVLTGQVVTHAFHGPRTELSVRCGEYVIAIDLPSDEARQWPPGADVGVTFVLDRVVLDAPSGAEAVADEE